MPDGSLVFPASEYSGRVMRLQAAMAQEGFDALLLTTPADVFYVTGFLTRFWESPARPWFVIVFADKPPVAVIPSIGSDLMGQTWMDTILTWDAPDPVDDGVSLLVKTLCDALPTTAQVGLPMGLETHARMPLATFEAVRSRIAPRVFKDGTRVLQSVREIKSEAEIEKIRATCEIADRAFARVPEFAAQGTPLEEVFREFQIALLAEGADWVSYVAGGAGPGGYGDVISPATATPLQAGDVLMLDTGAVKDGYFCDFDRNYMLGALSDPAERAHKALWHTTETALYQIRPGMRACDVHRIMFDTLKAEGVTPAAGRFGHGLGLTLTEWPSFSAKDQTELRENMVLTLEPGAITTDGKLLVHEENIVLRAGGPELLSARAPFEMVRLPA